MECGITRPYLEYKPLCHKIGPGDDHCDKRDDYGDHSDKGQEANATAQPASAIGGTEERDTTCIWM